MYLYILRSLKVTSGGSHMRSELSTLWIFIHQFVKNLIGQLELERLWSGSQVKYYGPRAFVAHPSKRILLT